MLSSYLEINNTLLKIDNNLIQFYSNEYIIKGKINITKEKVENSLEDIMSLLAIGKKYEINGEDYDIKITPINCFIMLRCFKCILLLFLNLFRIIHK